MLDKKLETLGMKIHDDRRLGFSQLSLELLYALGILLKTSFYVILDYISLIKIYNLRYDTQQIGVWRIKLFLSFSSQL